MPGSTVPLAKKETVPVGATPELVVVTVALTKKPVPGWAKLTDDTLLMAVGALVTVTTVLVALAL